jgi:hypothetical protein
MTVIKMRGSEHSKDLRLYDVTKNGLVIGETLYDYRGIITGVARRHLADESNDSGLQPERVIESLRRSDFAWAQQLGRRVRRAATVFLEHS